MKDENDNSKQLVLSQQPVSNLDVLDLDLKNNTEGAMEVLTKIVASKKYDKLTTPEVALSYYLKSKELGLPFMSSIDHM